MSRGNISSGLKAFSLIVKTAIRKQAEYGNLVVTYKIELNYMYILTVSCNHTLTVKIREHLINNYQIAATSYFTSNLPLHNT